MKPDFKYLFLVACCFLLAFCNEKITTFDKVTSSDLRSDSIINRTDEEWRKHLTPLQFHLLREKGTEYPFTGAYYDFFEEGTYQCAGCGTVLFKSTSKFHSGCGWPAFSKPWDDSVIVEQLDTSLGMIRTEILCRKCGGHLGHVFNDGPPPTGLRYCINSGALEFRNR